MPKRATLKKSVNGGNSFAELLGWAHTGVGRLRMLGPNTRSDVEDMKIGDELWEYRTGAGFTHITPDLGEPGWSFIVLERNPSTGAATRIFWVGNDGLARDMEINEGGAQTNKEGNLTVELPYIIPWPATREYQMPITGI